MSLNIKDPEAHELAQKLSRLTGETMTRVVTEALREQLARVNRERQRGTATDDLLAIGRRCAATLKAKPIEHGSLLYDEQGLPK